MVICGYVLIAATESADALALRIAALPGCDVVRAQNHGMLLVVTEAEDAESDAALRERVVGMEGVRSLALTFGEVEAGAS